MASPREPAYRATTYAVEDGTHRLAIRIGERCPALDALLAAHGLEECAYLTAHNPGGLPADPGANAAAQARLEAELVASGRVFLRGASHGDGGSWGPEPSLLVLGLGRAEALALARRYGQEALVTARCGKPAELVFCEE
jgi:hypothetical protein